MGVTDFLYARPSFGEGVARTIDLFGVLQEYNCSKTETGADAWAMYQDFKVVGDDIKKSITEIKK